MTSDSLPPPAGALTAALVVASDIHLQHMADRRARLLLDVLGRLSPEVEYFVLNGDVFDFCFGAGDYYRRKFRPLGQALAAVAARGTRVVFVEGNHEFHMREIGWDGIEVITAKDYVVTLRSGLRVQLTHGDQLTGDPLYKAFRGVVKSRFARGAAAYIPGAWLDAYSLRHAKVSRSQDRYRKLDHAHILGAFDRWLATGAADHGIIGHFHVPYAERRPTHPGLMLSVESWDNPNLLVYAGDHFARIHLREPGMPFQCEPVEPLFAF